MKNDYNIYIYKCPDCKEKRLDIKPSICGAKGKGKCKYTYTQTIKTTLIKPLRLTN